MEPTNIPTWITVIGNFGFPIFITIYLFLRFERKLESLEGVILKLSNVINNLKDKSS